MSTRKKAIVLLVGVFTVWAAIATAMVIASKREALGSDFCARDVTRLAASTVIALDVTDRYDAGAQAGIETRVLAIAAALSQGERLALHVIAGDPQATARPFSTATTAAFARCKPQDPHTVNPAIASERLVAAAYEKTFVMPLKASLAAAFASPSAKHSPILGAIEAALWARAWGNATDRRLVLFSDLLENTQQRTQLKGAFGDPCAVAASGEGERLRLQGMAGLKIDVQYQRNGQYLDRQGTEHIQYWTRLWQALGATVSVNGTPQKQSAQCPKPLIVFNRAAEPTPAKGGRP